MKTSFVLFISLLSSLSFSSELNVYCKKKWPPLSLLKGHCLSSVCEFRLISKGKLGGLSFERAGGQKVFVYPKAKRMKFIDTDKDLSFKWTDLFIKRFCPNFPGVGTLLKRSSEPVLDNSFFIFEDANHPLIKKRDSIKHGCVKFIRNEKAKWTAIFHQSKKTRLCP